MRILHGRLALCVQHPAAVILSKANPRLFLVLGINALLVGVGLLTLAAYLTLKHPAEMKRRAWLRRFKKWDWAQYLAGGIFFTSMGVVGVLSSLDGMGHELSDIETGVGRGFLIVAVLALLFLGITKVLAKFDQ